MIVISHRGNLNGPNPKQENKLSYIKEAIDLGFHCEIDLWVENDKYYLGHDMPQYLVSVHDLIPMVNNLWIHCKNVEAMVKLTYTGFHYFWHEEDKYTLTSNGYIWAYPGSAMHIPSRSIAVMPEKTNIDISNFTGVCTDYPYRYV